MKFDSNNSKALPQLQSAKLLERLRANESQSSTQTSYLNELLCVGQNELDQCEAEIARLNGLLSSVQRHRDDLQSHLDMARSLMSPIRKLPPEILAEIL